MWAIPMSLQSEFGIGPEAIVRFIQLTTLPDSFHDALQFEHGKRISLQALKEGQRVRVLSLGFEDPERVYGWSGHEGQAPRLSVLGSKQPSLPTL
jgi:hypothetical protein